MDRFLLLGNRSIQHSLAARLKSEGSEVHVFPGQNFGGYEITVDPDVDNYDCIVVGSSRYFSDALVQKALKSRACGVFGVDGRAGLLESSKSFFADFALENNIRAPESRAFMDFQEALDFVRSHEPPYVIKANGPARGCGVAILSNITEAQEDLHRKLVDKQSPYFSGGVTIEQYVHGFEVAVNVLIDDRSFVILPPTKPYKRRNDNDVGPNTAGMGSVSPVSLNADFYRELENGIIMPTMKAIRSKEWYFRGCLFMNLMLNDEGIHVLEFNCRMGDPAMLVNIELLESSLTDLLLLVAQSRLSEATVIFKNGFALATTIVSARYPDAMDEAGPFVLPVTDPKSRLFIAGLHSTQGGLFSNNGVIGCAVAYDISLEVAKSRSLGLARAFMSSHPTVSLHMRSDIGDSIEVPRRFF